MIAWPNLITPVSKRFLNNLLFFPVYQVIWESEVATILTHARYPDMIYPVDWFTVQVHKKVYSVAPLNTITPYQVRKK